ncbi:MAG: murein biosynthesis integral membrane protein MurJ [Clostridiales bacterium]|jgi:murein biosynthesis integral membrane protein MurJ|nr:murein biosynthesis integral membrane protein MurJ [Clostridiales bacterium]
MEARNGQNSGVKTISVVIILVIFAKLSGLVRDMVVLSLLGTESAEAAAFTFATLLPRNFLDAAFAAAISAGFIPVFNKYLEQRNREEAFDLARNFITFVAIVSFLAALLGFLGVRLIAGLYFGADAVGAIPLGAELLRISIFTMFFTSVAFALTGLLQSLGGFYIPSIMSLVSNGLILGYLLLFFDGGGVYGLVVAFVLGSILQVLIFWLPLRKQGFKFRPKLSLKDEGLRQILRLTPMVMLASWLFPINGLINGAIAANYNSAYLVELNAATQIYLVLAGMFILSVTNVMFPKLSKEAARGENRAEFSQTLSGAVSGMAFIIFPMTAGIFLLRTPIVRLIFERGEFTAEATQRVSYALGILTLSIIGYGLVSILSRALYADHDGKTPMFITIVAIAINFAVAMIFVNILGIGGPALAAAISVNLAGLAMYVAAARKFDIFSKSAALNFGKMLLAAAIMLTALILMQPRVAELHDILEIALITISGVAIYFVAAWVLKINEAKAVRGLIFGRKGTKDE